MPGRDLNQADYTVLAEFRYLLRDFLEFSENEARKGGLTPRHHQALLAIKGYGGGRPSTVGDLANVLILFSSRKIFYLINENIES